MKKDSIKNLGRNSRTKDKLPYNLENNVALNKILPEKNRIIHGVVLYRMSRYIAIGSDASPIYTNNHQHKFSIISFRIMKKKKDLI